MGLVSRGLGLGLGRKGFVRLLQTLPLFPAAPRPPCVSASASGEDRSGGGTWKSRDWGPSFP